MLLITPNSMPLSWCLHHREKARAYEADLANPPEARAHVRELLSQLDRPPMLPSTEDPQAAYTTPSSAAHLTNAEKADLRAKAVEILAAVPGASSKIGLIHDWLTMTSAPRVLALLAENAALRTRAEAAEKQAEDALLVLEGGEGQNLRQAAIALVGRYCDKREALQAAEAQVAGLKLELAEKEVVKLKDHLALAEAERLMNGIVATTRRPDRCAYCEEWPSACQCNPKPGEVQKGGANNG